MSSAKPALYLFDDRVARGFEPFSSTRPVGEMLFGGFTARRRAELVFDLSCEGHLAGPDMVGFDELGAAPGRPADAERPSRARVLLNSRFVPDWDAALPDVGGEPVALLCGNQVCGWVVPAGSTISEQRFASAEAEPGEAATEVVGAWLQSPWDLMHRSAEQVRSDIESRHLASRPILASRSKGKAEKLPDGVHVVGAPEGLSCGEDVEIEPGVVLDTSAGPIRLDDGVQVRAFTRLAGPAWIGQGSALLGGSFASVSVGPRCKLRGEMESTVVFGYSNKAHDGFLGHAVLGCWVNLGAGTTNSDLKNNYGRVRLQRPEGAIDTGLRKVGCFLGDHVKTGIGTMLNTGTSIGAGSNVFGGIMPPAWVPAFSWGAGSDLGPYRLDRFLEVAEVAMGRREMPLTPGLRAVLDRAWRRAQGESPGEAEGTTE